MCRTTATEAENTVLVTLRFFDGRLQRIARVAGDGGDAIGFGFRDLPRVYAGDPASVQVHLHHHAVRLGGRFLEQRLEHVDDEHHRRVVVVQQDDVDERRLLLLLDVAAGSHYVMNVPLRRSLNACWSSASVFITIGPYHATGSSIGRPETRRNRIPSSPAWTTISSPRSNSTSARLPVSPSTPERAMPPSICSVSTPRGSEASRNVPEPANTYANAWFVVSTASRLRAPGGTDTSRYRGSAATPSIGPCFPQNSPQITRTRVPSLSVISGMSCASTSW